MTIDPWLLPISALFFAVLSFLTVPLAAAAFFACALLLFLNPAPLPDDFLFSYSLALRLNSPALISIPLFALAGELAVAAGITGRLLDVSDVLGSGGSHAAGKRTVLGCSLFATVSGVGPAAVREEGKRLLPEMIAAGYNPAASAGLLAAAAGASIIIPASIPLTIYAATTGMATNHVFVASFVPGLVVAAALMLAITVFDLAHSRRISPLARPARCWMDAVADAKWSILLPLLVLGSLFSGILTAPEAAAFAGAYSLVVGMYVYKSIDGAAVWSALGRAAAGASAVLLMAGTGGLVVMLLESNGFTERMGAWIFYVAGGRIGSILAVNLVLLVAGCLMDMPAIITLVAPLFLPLAAMAGMSLPQYGVMVVVNLAIGLITPPQATNLSAAAREAGIAFGDAVKGSLPFLAAMLLCLGLVAYIPTLSTWLPSVLGWVS